jgi:hypothetical protein
MSVVCLITTSVSGQRQITGKIIDGETKKPVKDALVKVEGANLETRSNFLGFFQLTIDSLNQLLIDSDGYELAKVQVPAVNSFQIALTKSIEQPIFLVVEKSATFPGGIPAFYDYIMKNLRFPRDARGINGKVFVDFVIDTTGWILSEDVKITKSLCKSCDAEAIRVVRGSPRWNPGTQRGKPVRQRLVLPIAFQTDAPETYYKDFDSFISQNIKYPYEARSHGIEGAVFVDFEVDQAGRVIVFTIVKDIGATCSDEVRRVILNVPSELMVSLSKQSNSQKFTLPVLFGLQQPFKNHELIPKSDGFLLSEVNITAINKPRETPSRHSVDPAIRVVARTSRIEDLNKALKKPAQVKYLSLINRGYKSFPMDILKLTNLEFLDLERNLLKELPPEVGQLTNLEELYLVENDIQNLPGNFVKLKKIKILGLASNKLKSFPEEITALEKLEALDLSNNDLSIIPPSIGRLKNLRVLAVQNNNIKNLPPEFYQLKKVERIYLKGNPIDVKEIDLLKRSFKTTEIILD